MFIKELHGFWDYLFMYLFILNFFVKCIAKKDTIQKGQRDLRKTNPHQPKPKVYQEILPSYQCGCWFTQGGGGIAWTTYPTSKLCGVFESFKTTCTLLPIFLNILKSFFFSMPYFSLGSILLLNNLLKNEVIFLWKYEAELLKTT